MKQIDLFSQYKAETGKNKSDIDLRIITQKGQLGIDNSSLYGDEVNRLEMSDYFISAHDNKFPCSELIAISDPAYIRWLESKLL